MRVQDGGFPLWGIQCCVTCSFLSNEKTIGPAVGLLSLVLSEACERRSGQEIIVEGQIRTKGSPFNQVYSSNKRLSKSAVSC